MAQIPKRLLLALVIGFVAGTVWLILVRFITYRPNLVHYHANFALYVNGEREKFDNFTYYEEVAACGTDEVNNPKTRVHMHDKIDSVVHVHDNAATWGHFFANLGLTLGNGVLQMDSGVYTDGTNNSQLRFILNGQEVGTIANQTIKSKDVLLIDYSNASGAELQSRYETIPRDAGEYNQKNDPASCKGSETLTLGERVKRAIGIGN